LSHIRFAHIAIAMTPVELACALLLRRRMMKDEAQLETLSIQHLENAVGGVLGVPGMTESGIRHWCPNEIVARHNPGCARALEILRARDEYERAQVGTQP
jgi:hypothetical protein